MPIRTRDLKVVLARRERTSGVAIEKSVFSTVARWSGPSQAKSMRSSVLSRAVDQGTPQVGRA
jgi:hypothetical protein